MSDTRHLCPGGCGQQIDRLRLACPDDWKRLPKPLRDDVLAAWKMRRTQPRVHLLAVSVALRWYRDHNA